MKSCFVFSILAMIVGASVPAHADTDDYDTFSDIGAVGVPLAAGVLALWKKDQEGVIDLGLTWGGGRGHYLGSQEICRCNKAER